MNINELMNGNWVAYKGKPYQVTGTAIDGAFGETVRIRIGKDDVEMNIKKVEPIKITNENMEWNGIDSAGLVTDDFVIYCKYNDLSIYLNYPEKPRMLMEIPICYIHELQNALRICGIEKQIELWRV